MEAGEPDRAIQALTSGQKYYLLKNHFKPGATFVFPSIFMAGCNRSFQLEWLHRYPWLVYSQTLDGGFCLSCALFCKKRRYLGVLVNTPFTKWVKVKTKVAGHQDMQYHQNALTDAQQFIHSVEHPQSTLPVLAETERGKRIEVNRHIVKCIAESVLYCGQQCIALRGDHENLNTAGNPGNFLALMKVLGNHDKILLQHLQQPQMKTATYLSPQSQNEMIDILGKELIQKPILDEVREAKFFSIMVDEVIVHNKEQMPLCVRFVDSERNIREEFIQFTIPERVTGEAIACDIIQSLDQLRLDVTHIRGQGYDGAANMSSDRVGVQARIRQESPLAVYMHCSGHCLNLVLAHSCKLPNVRKVTDMMTAVCLFFNSSPKRDSLLQNVITTMVPDASRRKPLLDLCKTRWAERQDAYRHFYQAYLYLVKTFEIIAYRMHQDKGFSQQLMAADWSTKSRADAGSLLASISSFENIVTFIVIYQLLSHLSGLAVKLQSRSLDIVDAYSMVSVSFHLIQFL